jgi:hypothetical protein
MLKVWSSDLSGLPMMSINHTKRAFTYIRELEEQVSIILEGDFIIFVL